ncbi:MAG: tetratricopeptide repeat protein, partial [Desulfobacterales bacterium]
MTLPHEIPKLKNTTAFLVILLMVLIAYSNTFRAEWHMDDHPNILKNPAIQITEMNLDAIKRAIGFDRSQGNNLPRPVVNLTFALNWYAHGTHVAGYHLVNLGFHFLNAWVLYLILIGLSKSPVVPETDHRQRSVIALMAALLWALNPIQTQAVTYVVQRYTSLTTFFYLSALYGYIRGRLSGRTRQVVVWWGLAVGSYLLAMGAKENAAIWPAAALLVEFVFFRDKHGRLSPHFKKILMAAAILSTLFIGGLLAGFNIDIINSITHGFDGRPFSLVERLMTQPRVLIFYLSQIFYPIPQRLSLEHDFAVSSDLLHPWTTLPAMLIVALLVIAALLAVRKRPLAAFAILFFFLNHVVESSVFPLEMVFEHRNYLPSLFLFWPLVAWAFRWQAKLSAHGRAATRALPILVGGVVIVFAAGTFTRNLDWQTERRLWLDTYRKAPQSARAAVNLANALAHSGHNAQAAALFEKAIDLNSPAQNQFKVIARNNLATLYARTGRRDQAVEQLEQVLQLVPQNRPARYQLANIYTEMGQFSKATEQVDWLLERHPDASRFLNLKAFLLIKDHRAEASLAVIRRSLTKKPGQRDALLAAGVAYAIIGNSTKADWFFRRTATTTPRDPMVYLCRLENFVANDQNDAAER